MFSLRCVMTDDQGPWLIGCFCRYFNQIGIFSEFLGLNEINPVLLQIGLALRFVELKCEHGIKIIPLLGLWQGGAGSASVPHTKAAATPE